MLCSRITGRAFQRAERSLTSDAAFELLFHFLWTALFEWVRATAQRQPRNRERNCEGLHPLIL